eukprot:scaffold613_cov243-Pinguiococcus_pyrenoidosus.AAC.35
MPASYCCRAAVKSASRKSRFPRALYSSASSQPEWFISKSSGACTAAASTVLSLFQRAGIRTKRVPEELSRQMSREFRRKSRRSREVLPWLCALTIFILRQHRREFALVRRHRDAHERGFA